MHNLTGIPRTPVRGTMAHMRRASFTILFTVALCGQAVAQDAKFTALFVLNFAKCVEWPAQGAELAIGVVGSDPVTDELKVIAQKTKLGSRSIAIRTFDSGEHTERCDILYVSPDKADALAGLLAKFETGTLIVSNKKGLAQQGAPINLCMIDGKQRYEINTEALKKTGLKVTPVLFKLGVTIN